MRWWTTAALVVVGACTRLPSVRERPEDEERRYQAGESFCGQGELAVCLDLAESDLRDYRAPDGPRHGDLFYLRRARGRLVHLCEDLQLAHACLRIFEKYDLLFEGRPGARPRAAYVERACALGIEEVCRPPSTIGRPAGPGARGPY